MWFKVVEVVKLIILGIALIFFGRSILFAESRTDLILAIDIVFYATAFAIALQIIALIRKESPRISAAGMANLLWFGFLKFIIPFDIFLGSDQMVYHSDFLIILSLLCIFFIGTFGWSTKQMLFPRLNPPKIGPFTLIALSFASVILLGTVLLYLPVARNVQDVQITLIDAFFTATSAVCVTGLTVVDTGGYFSRFGQTVILGLVQVGGLGLMTLAGFFWTIMGEKMSLFNRFTTQNAVSDLSAKGTGRFISSIIISTLVIELFGAGLLFIRFAGEMPIGDAVYTSIFHAISAFCNAGFGLFSDSLMKYRGDWLINWTVMSLIFLGGIGFTVLVNVTRFLRTKDRHITMHSKLVLITSGLLIVFGAIIFFILENDNIYKNMGINETFLSSIFTSVTARTAGFNTIDYGLAKDASLLFLCVLMFIGASPGSTGGGIKTTTFTILIFTILNTLRERQAVTFMEREVTLVTVRKALTIFFLSFSWVMLVIVLVSSIENTKFPLSHVIFETISAFGTVGLSAGITAKLTDMSKIIITLTMFFGRIGPLGLVLALGIMAKKTQIQYPDEKILIG